MNTPLGSGLWWHEFQDILYDYLRDKNIEDLPGPLQQAIAEREQLQQSNYQLQHKLAEYFRKKKADESRQDYDKNVTDQEQRYLKYMGKLELQIRCVLLTSINSTCVVSPPNPIFWPNVRIVSMRRF